MMLTPVKDRNRQSKHSIRIYTNDAPILAHNALNDQAYVINALCEMAAIAHDCYLRREWKSRSVWLLTCEQFRGDELERAGEALKGFFRRYRNGEKRESVNGLQLEPQ